MPFDAFLKFSDTIVGESTDDKHRDEIELVGFRWSVTQGRRKPEIEDVVVVKLVDAASPLIAQAACNGTVFPWASLSLNQAGGNKLQFGEYTLTNVSIRSVEVEGTTAGAAGTPTESVGLGFDSLTFAYSRIGPDGNPGARVTGECTGSGRR